MIAITDDDPAHFFLLERIFKKEKPDSELKWFKNGEELIVFLASNTPEIVLLDIRMPILDGKETLKIIKSDPRFDALPITVFTTSADPRDEVFVHQFKNTRFVTKPDSLSEYTLFVRNILSQLKS